MEDARLPPDLSHRLRNYFRYRRYQVDAKEWHGMLDTLSPSLRAEVAMHLNAEWMEKIPFFKSCPSTMLIKLSFVIKTESYPPDETFILADKPATKLCLIKKGVIVAKGRILNAGMVLGEEMLADNDRLNGYDARAMTYSDLMVLTREDLMTILKDFPEEKKRMRNRAVRRIVRDNVVAYARACRELEDQMMGRSETGKNQFSNMLLAKSGTFDQLSYGNQLGVMMKVDPAAALKLEQSAVKLQARAKGMLARNTVCKMKEEKAEYGLEGAAVVAARQTKEILNAIAALTDRLKRVEEQLKSGDGD